MDAAAQCAGIAVRGDSERQAGLDARDAGKLPAIPSSAEGGAMERAARQFGRVVDVIHPEHVPTT